jgi:type II secretory pathway component HofQ
VSVVPGDPASLSACAATVRRVADGLAEHGDSLGAAVAELADGWGGREASRTRRRGDVVAAAAGTTAGALDQVSVVLQDHATDLADLLARARSLEGRAAAAGLELRDGRVVPTLGVAGEADAGEVREREAVAAAVQEEVDAVAARHARRRDWVLGVLRESTDELAAVSHALRRG